MTTAHELVEQLYVASTGDDLKAWVALVETHDAEVRAAVAKTPAKRQHILDSLAEILFTDPTCAYCDPSGGCPDDLRCRLDQAEKVFDLIERESR